MTADITQALVTILIMMWLTGLACAIAVGRGNSYISSSPFIMQRFVTRVLFGLPRIISRLLWRWIKSKAEHFHKRHV